SQLPVAQANSVSKKLPESKFETAVKSPTISPTPTHTPSETEPVVVYVASSTGLVEKNSSFKISPFDTTKNVSLIVVGLLSIATVIDGALIAVRKVPRIGGKNFAHFAFLVMIIAIVIVAKAGEIL
ncbi:MAG: hypothetical protein NZM26_03660, partial [Patescibacteria group bacterium]|nr:hypothetical protein [Patescibacteria group bacterium]